MSQPAVRSPLFEQGALLLALAVTVFYTCAQFFAAPYAGFRFDPRDGTIDALYVTVPGRPTLQLGDRLVQVGPVTCAFTDAHRTFWRTGRRHFQVAVERAGEH
jgi:hypothetical protein